MKAKEQEKVLKILEIVKKIMKLLLKSCAGFREAPVRGAWGGSGCGRAVTPTGKWGGECNITLTIGGM